MTDVMLPRSESRTPDLDALRRELRGSLTAPGDASWDEARAAWNLFADQRPAAVVHAESVADVVATVNYAREHGLGVAPQGTGHFALPLGDLEGTILLKTSRMRKVEVDAAARRVRVEAGVIWQEVLDAAQPHGLTALAGSSHDVGVVGYSLGGGMGWLARRYGLSANSVTAVEIVTADGRFVRADARNDADLFWAVRGGGGSFGVVTALELELYPVAEVYAGVLFFPLERAYEVLHEWRQWTENVPDTMTSCGRILRFPPIPEIPEPLRGNSFAVIEVAYTGHPEVGLELLAPLRALGPAMDTVARIPASALTQIHMDPPSPAPGVGDGGFLATLPTAAIEAMLEVAGPGVESPLLSVEIRHLGGALAREKPGHGAVGTIDARYVFFSVGVAVSPETGALVAQHAAMVREALAEWEDTRTYFNFTERDVDGDELYPSATHARLREIKAKYDPDELLRVVHPIRPAR
jgi:FAD binding domain/Berberine and berberine like